jgi:23S rRNA (cytidine1920-2'-O)/16S rRNA (cytidine1409-2'-O)-methyltransferase
MKTRLDRLLVERGLAESREKAQALIMAGEVRVQGQKAGKPGQMVEGDCALEVMAKPPYVSRGGLKLAGAIRQCMRWTSALANSIGNCAQTRA